MGDAPRRAVLVGDVRERLRDLPDESVHCVVTSPPYFGLRDYGDPRQIGLESVHDCLAWARREPPCGACYVCGLRSVFGGPESGDGVWRVLRRDGTLWLNLGDSFATGAGKVGDHPGGGEQGKRWLGQPQTHRLGPVTQPNRLPLPGLKPKDLCLVPARVALALQADGWWVRRDHPWAKPNPMPESTRDRGVSAHEYVFHLAKSERYHFDWFSVLEDAVGDASGNAARENGHQPEGRARQKTHVPWSGATKRFMRSVWTIAVRPFKGAHFATFPPELPERCIRAGTSERGACATCGAPWIRLVEKRPRGRQRQDRGGLGDGHRRLPGGNLEVKRRPWQEQMEYVSLGWEASCACDAGEPVPCVVLDPFAGAFTACEVAARLGRDWIGIELNPEYAEIGRKRLADFAAPLRAFSTAGGGP